MRVIVPIHRVQQPHAVSDETLLCMVEDPKGREGLTLQDAEKLFKRLHDVTLRMGPGITLVMADPGADAGLLLIVRVEILRTDMRINDAVATIQQLALEAFERL